MSTQDTSGPAFPAMHFDMADGEHGLSIRDYFAAKALQGILAVNNNFDKLHCDSFDEYLKSVSDSSYEYADAMLKARKS